MLYQVSKEDYTDNLLQTDLTTEPVTDKKVELARHLYVSLESQIMLADRKVQAVFGLNAFLVAAISLQSQQSPDTILTNGLTTGILADLFLKGIFLCCVCTATWSAVKALSPGVKTKPGEGIGKQKSLFFFSDINRQTLKEYSEAFLCLDNLEAVKELLTSAHAVSGILAVKYKMLKRSTNAISLALLIWMIIQINKFLG